MIPEERVRQVRAAVVFGGQDYMKSVWRLICVGVLAALTVPGGVFGRTGPFDGKTFAGRIAFSSDGNYNDEDD